MDDPIRGHVTQNAVPMSLGLLNDYGTVVAIRSVAKTTSLNKQWVEKVNLCIGNIPVLHNITYSCILIRDKKHFYMN